MQRKRHGREFKLEPVKLVRERGVSVAQAARDLDIHANLLRDWVKVFADNPAQAFPGDGQLKPEQLEIARLKREVTRLKAERDILKNHLGQRPPVGVETVEVYPLGGRERPTAFWWHATPQKNMVHGLLRTCVW
jgi:transposase